jgi:hypothetical protein
MNSKDLAELKDRALMAHTHGFQIGLASDLVAELQVDAGDELPDGVVENSAEHILALIAKIEGGAKADKKASKKAAKVAEPAPEPDPVTEPERVTTPVDDPAMVGGGSPDDLPEEPAVDDDKKKSSKKKN